MYYNKFTRKDPLSESVKQVMIENDIRRQVELTLNEQLGIQSRKQLPHELHESYDNTLKEAIHNALNENCGWSGKKMEEELSINESHEVTMVTKPSGGAAYQFRGYETTNKKNGNRVQSKQDLDTGKHEDYQAWDESGKSIPVTPEMKKAHYEAVKAHKSIEPFDKHSSGKKIEEGIMRAYHQAMVDRSNRRSREAYTEDDHEESIEQKVKSKKHNEKLKDVMKNRRPLNMPKPKIEEELVGNQHRIDANKNNRVDAGDFEILRKAKKPVEEELNKALGGNPITRKDPAAPQALEEKAVSKAQHRFMGLVRAIQKGKAHGSAKAEEAAKSMSTQEVRKFAKTEEKGLPEKKKLKEEIETILEEIRHNLEEKFIHFYENGNYELMEEFLDSLTEEQADLLGLNLYEAYMSHGFKAGQLYSKEMVGRMDPAFPRLSPGPMVQNTQNVAATNTAKDAVGTPLFGRKPTPTPTELATPSKPAFSPDLAGPKPTLHNTVSPNVGRGDLQLGYGARPNIAASQAARPMRPQPVAKPEPVAPPAGGDSSGNAPVPPSPTFRQSEISSLDKMNTAATEKAVSAATNRAVGGIASGTPGSSSAPAPASASAPAAKAATGSSGGGSSGSSSSGSSGSSSSYRETSGQGRDWKERAFNPDSGG